jgi:hypothetical protein
MKGKWQPRHGDVDFLVLVSVICVHVHRISKRNFVDILPRAGAAATKSV